MYGNFELDQLLSCVAGESGIFEKFDGNFQKNC